MCVYKIIRSLNFEGLYSQKIKTLKKFTQEQSEGLGGPLLLRPSKTSPYRLREY